MIRLAGLLLKDIEELYVRRDFECDDVEVIMPRGTLSFDTYFNSLSCDVLYRHTGVRSVVARVELIADAAVSVWHKTSDGERSLGEKTASGVVELQFALPENGIVYLKIRALDEQVKVLGGGYYVRENAKNEVSIAVVICTYKREEYVKKNVKVIADHTAKSDLNVSVYVVDNGGTLSAEDVEGSVLIANPNLGGSGGFCRGMAEAKKTGKFTHVLLMDDDISFESDILDRIYAFLQLVEEVEKVGVGASMLIEEEPTKQFELGALWDGLRIKSLGKNLCLNDTETLLENATPREADYTAWWCCCMPVSVMDRVGYPLPFFIKNDDVEYGVRSGLQWAFIGGVGVWHSSFEGKYSPHLEYYIKRNELISNCLNRRLGALSQYVKLVRSVSINLLQQRYFALPYIVGGYADFFKGPKYFMGLDLAKKNAELLAGRPELYDAEELAAMGYDVSQPVHGRKRKKLWQIVTLNGQLLPTFAYKKADRVRVIDQSDCPPRDFFGATTLVQFNYNSKKGFVTKQKRRELFKYGFILLGLGVKTLFRYRKVCKDYRLALPEMTNLSFWESKWKNDSK